MRRLQTSATNQNNDLTVSIPLFRFWHFQFWLQLASTFKFSASVRVVEKKLLATARVLTAVFVAIPGTIAAPFAIWLMVASILQFIYHQWIVSLLVILVCALALITLGLVWAFVIFGIFTDSKLRGDE